MARPSGNATDDRRRPRSSGLNLRDIRYVRPQMRATSMPADTTPAPAPAQPTRPPGMVASSSSVSAAPPTYVRSTEDSLLCDPSRLNQPCLHPDKLNGALWFGDDLEVHAFVRATWQGDYWGPWQSWVVPEQKRTGGWHSFIQKYYWEDRFHDEIHFRWRHQTQVTICGRISQKRTTNKQPKYISEDDWKIVLANWSTEEAKAKSQSASESRCSPPPGMKMHAHGAGPHCFANVEHRMMIDGGLDAPPSYPDLARRTHTGKDGTFIDEWTEALVLEVEQAVEEMLQDGSPVGDSQTSSTAGTANSKRLLLNQEYIKRGKTRKGTIYGLGSVQLKKKHPSESVPAALNRNLDLEMRVCGLEATNQEIKADVQVLKTDFKEAMGKNQSSLDMILQFLQPQASNPAASPAQPTQSKAPPECQAQAPAEGHAQAPSPAHDNSPAQGEYKPQLFTTDHPELDRWCNQLGL